MKTKTIFLLLFIFLLFAPSVIAAEDDDIEVFGLELEKLLYFGSALLASALFIVTVVAYNRIERARLICVAMAFLLFAVKGFLISSELFIEELAFVDPLSSLLDFVILLLFFVGMLRK